MASVVTVIDQCNRIRAVRTMHDLGNLVMDFPQTIFSSKCLAETMKVIPKIIASRDDTCFDYHFIKAVIETSRCREMKGYTQTFMKDTLDMPGGLAPNDYALSILRCYAAALIDKTKGECLSHDNVRNGYDPRFISEHTDAYGYLGWIFLVIDWEHPNPLADKVAERFFYHETLVPFLMILADALAAMYDSKRAAYFLGRAWSIYSNRKQSDDLGTRYTDLHRDFTSTFISKCKRLDLDWLDSIIREMECDNVPASEEDVQNANDLYVYLSNAFNDRFVAENYFFEYIAQLAHYYPLMKQRADIAARYEQYFPDYAMQYMADFTNECIVNFSMLGRYDDKAATRAAYNPIHRKAEWMILDLHRRFPDVEPKVIRCFFRDTCNAFSRGFNGAAPGAMLVIDAIIDSLEKKDKMAVESELDSLDLLFALEGSYGDDDESGSDFQNTGLHEKAKTKSDVKMVMKDAERKIYNGYHKYKKNEEKVDDTLNKGIAALKKAMVGDQQAILIEGKKFSAIGFLKKALLTIAIFNYSKIAGILFLIVKQAMSSKTKRTEKKKILEELEEELTMVNEKIEDARGDGNREAKYDLMRTKNALENAIRRIKYGMGAEEKQGMKDAERIKATLDQGRYNARNQYQG